METDVVTFFFLKKKVLESKCLRRGMKTHKSTTLIVSKIQRIQMAGLPLAYSNEIHRNGDRCLPSSFSNRFFFSLSVGWSAFLRKGSFVTSYYRKDFATYFILLFRAEKKNIYSISENFQLALTGHFASLK